MDKKALGKMFDHTLLKATAVPDEIETICEEAKKIGAASVCVNPTNVRQAAKLLNGSEVKVCTVVGFPLGANTSKVKAFETADAIENGAQEIDMVINIGQLLAGNYAEVVDDIRAVVTAAKGKLVKVIIETCYLTDPQKVMACKAAAEAGADFVKTSTGFGTGGATVQDVALMKASIPKEMHVKASGGIRTWEQASAVIEAGAERLGVSASLAILDSFEKSKNQ